MGAARKATHLTQFVVNVAAEDTAATIPFPRIAAKPDPQEAAAPFSPMLARLYAIVIQRGVGFLNWISGRRLWLFSGTCLAVFCSLVITCPRLVFFKGDSQILNIWPLVIEQGKHPLSTNLPFIYNQPNTFLGKRAYRLTVPLLTRALKFNPKRMILLQWGLGFLMLYLAGRVTFSLFGDKTAALAVVFALSAAYPGKVAFLELGGRGDGFALAFFMIALAVPLRSVIFLMTLLACFTDERAIIASVLVWLYWMVRDGGLRWSVPAWFRSKACAVLLALLCTAVLRVLLHVCYELHLPTGSANGVGGKVMLFTVRILDRFLPRTFGGLWLAVTLAFVMLLRRRHWMAALVFGVLTCGCIAADMAAYDLERGLGFLLPLLFVALAILAQCGITPRDISELGVLAFVLTLLLPVFPPLLLTGNRYLEGNLIPLELYRYFTMPTP